VHVSKAMRIFITTVLAFFYIALLLASVPHRVHHLEGAFGVYQNHRIDERSTHSTSSRMHVASGVLHVARSQPSETGDSHHRPTSGSAEACVLSLVSAQNPVFFCAAVDLVQVHPAFFVLPVTAPQLLPLDLITPRATRAPPLRYGLV
jgi:hypothetical protein